MNLIFGTDLGLLSTVVDTGDLFLDSPRQVTTSEIDGITYVYVASAGSNGVQVFNLDQAGQLTPVASIADTAGTALGGASSIKAFEVDGTRFVMVGGLYEQGLSLFTATDSAPYLTFANTVLDSADPAYNLDRPLDIETVTLSGGAFAYVTGDFSNGLSVFRVGTGGSMTNVLNIDDSDDAAYRLEGPFSVEHFTRGSTEYIAVTGRSEDGVSIFSIEPGTKQLSNVANFSSLAMDGSW